MSESLKGKIAVVTGASRGIGRAIATRLGRDGALIAVHYGRNQKSAESTVREIEAAGGAAFAIGVELGSVESVEQLFKALDAELTNELERIALIFWSTMQALRLTRRSRRQRNKPTTKSSR